MGAGESWPANKLTNAFHPETSPQADARSINSQQAGWPLSARPQWRSRDLV